ncbi:hypothetical protein Nwat_0764 [Nitrosococcus watsonii C-113]|uniref:Uncharacterized protein n=1 Tax=Nitrosococcus watsoni (strain C-113) TaxID=105559 RepID=D8KBV7_NITWC|nr:hypothetical protein Nwat_0764 [Nitrosococcus watsonii C-113]
MVIIVRYLKAILRLSFIVGALNFMVFLDILR